MKTLRVFEAFAGIGTQRMALRNLGIEHKVVGIAEVDEFALNSYAAIHEEDVDVEDTSEEEMCEYLRKLNIPLNDKGELKNPRGKKLKNVYTASKKARNLGDISKIRAEDVPEHDLFTYSFPCQDISVAGKGEGFSKDSGTRSGLLWECERIITEKKPKYLLMENVKNLVSKKFMAGFEEWQDYLGSIGYTNYWEVLNAKDYGVPQNRERVFMVSILGEHEPYIFPKPIKLEKRLKDVLENEVDEKYYLNNEKAEQLIATTTEKNDITNPTVVDATVNEPKTKEIMNTITARYDAGIQNYKSIGGAVTEPEIKQVGNTTPNPKRENPQTGRTYDADGLAPTLNTMQGGNRQLQIIEPSFVIGSTQKNASVTDGSYSPTLTSSMGTGGGHVPMIDEPKLEFVGGLKEDKKWLDDGKDNSRNFSQGSRVYDSMGLATALTAQGVGGKGGYSGLYKVPEPKIATSRGRNPENSSDRTKGAPTEQRLEVSDEGTINTLTTVQKDNYVLEPNVLTPKRTEYGKAIRKDYESGKIKESRHSMTRLEPRKDGVSNTLTTVQKDNYVFEPNNDDVKPINPLKGKTNNGWHFEQEVYDDKGIARALKAGGGSGNIPKTTEGIPIKNNTEQGYLIAKEGDGVDLAYPTSNTRRGRVQEGMAQTLTADDSKGVVELTAKEGEPTIVGAIYNNREPRVHDEYAPTLRSERHGLDVVNNFRIRKLTPLECFRLMGVTDEDFYKAQAVNSNAQLYKQAGNSIVVNVLERIFANMFYNE